jgi:hypothetical protein
MTPAGLLPSPADTRLRHGWQCIVLVALGLLFALGSAAPAGAAEAKPTWRLEPVFAPPGAGGAESKIPIGLGKVGDIEFFAPNRGLLITAGNGEAVGPSVWDYNGVQWREISEVCGATDGRIAWAGPDEFWTVSDGRKGQVTGEKVEPPLEDDTLCHFAAPHGTMEVVGSYASLAFLPTSYQAMHAAACLSPDDCWFGGNELPSTAGAERGAFQLHWNGSTVTEQPYPADHTIEGLRRFGRFLYESVLIGKEDEFKEGESPVTPPVLHLITPIGVQPTFVSLTPGVPQYAPEELPSALQALALGVDEEELWGAADPHRPAAEGAEVTILRLAGGSWSQVLGHGSDPPGGNPFTQPGRSEELNEKVTSISPEPGHAGAWLALAPEAEPASHMPLAQATVAHISPTGEVTERQSLPAPGEAGPKGSAAQLTCPAAGDCWMVTTQGWLFHLTTEAALQAERRDPNGDAAFSTLIAARPHDEGTPSVVPDAPPPDDSGLLGEAPPALAQPLEVHTAPVELKIPVALVSGLHTHLSHGTTLELSFHLAAKARVRLVAQKRTRVVASTSTRTLGVGTHKLVLRLKRNEWPNKLDLQAHALTALPTTGTRSPSVNTVSTGLYALPPTPSFGEAETLP